MPLTEENVSRIISGAYTHRLVEILRRWVLVLGLLLAAVFATWTDFRPYYVVSAPDMSAIGMEQVLTRVLPPKNLASEGDDALIPESAQREKNGKSVVVVTGAEWQSWFNPVNRALTSGELSDNWLYRLSADQVRDVKRYQEKKTSFKPDIRRLVFAQNEAPLSGLFDGKKPGCDEILLVLNSGGERQVLKVYFSRAPELTGLGSGVYGVPEAFSYPLRHLWYVPLLVMLSVYVILPVAMSADNVCVYKRWQVILCDLVGCMLYGMFMALPFFIVGGTIEALTTWIGFTAIFWAMAALGLCLLWWSYFYAVYRIHVVDDRLVFCFPSAIKVVAFKDMTTLEHVRVVPPKWLIVLSFWAALLGKGARGAGQLGRASLLATSSSEGLCIGTRDGDAVYIWLTNSMGENSLTHFDLLLDSLKAAPAEELADVRQFEAIFPPNIERYDSRKTSKSIKRNPASETVLEAK